MNVRMASNRWKQIVLTFTTVVLLVVVVMCVFVTNRTNKVLVGSLHSLREVVIGRGTGPCKVNWTNRLVHLAVSACGDRLEEALTMLKSAVLFTNTFLVFHIVTGNQTQQRQVREELDSWPSNIQARMKYNIYDPEFPADVSCPSCAGIKWESLFLPCASQRLFYGDLLKGVDSVVYVDADTLFFAPVEELWSMMYRFNSTQFVAAAYDIETPNVGIYHERNIPFYGLNGINSGVMLMNLTRLRTSNWLTSVTRALIKHGKNATYGDQDLINVFMHDYPEHSFLLTCDWNYHGEQCNACYKAEQTGVAVLHSTRHAFVNDEILSFKAIYLAFKQFKLGNHSVKFDLLGTMKRNLEDVKFKKSGHPNKCHLDPNVYTKRIEDFIKRSELP